MSQKKDEDEVELGIINIRIKSKTKQQKIHELLLNLAQFKNLLILMISSYREHYKSYELDTSFLYTMLTDKEYRSKNKEKRQKCADFLEKIMKCEKTSYWLDELKKQREKVDNNYLLQTTIRQVVGSYKSYFAARSDFNENPSKYRGEPKPPKVKKLKYLMNYSTEFNTLCLKLEDNRLQVRLRMSGKISIAVALGTENIYSEENIRSARLLMIGSDYYLHVVYKQPPKRKEACNNYIVGIDPGLDNLFSVFSTHPNLKSFIISGKELKAFNQWWNKLKAKWQSQFDMLRDKKRNQKTLCESDFKQLNQASEKLRHLSALRKRFFENELHKISRKLVDILHSSGHSTIYIGTGATNSKQNINIGKRNNQNFCSIPFSTLIGLVSFKADKLGMNVVLVSEEYTSKSSCISDDIIEIQKLVKQDNRDQVSFSGKRKKRGLFHDRKINKVFNADLNGAANILKAGAQLHKINLSLNTLLIKLANPLRMKLMKFYYQVSGESLGIAGSRT